MASVSLRRPVGSTCKSAFASRRQQQLSNARRTFASSPKNTKQIEDAYIVSAVRTPCGIFNGSFTNVPATQLGSTAIREAISRSSIPADRIGHVYMGNVLQAASGQAPARQAALGAGLAPSV
ncbi:hypothetical protein KC365_g9837, partial [Hortaea werneckii]